MEQLSDVLHEHYIVFAMKNPPMTITKISLRYFRTTIIKHVAMYETVTLILEPGHFRPFMATRNSLHHLPVADQSDHTADLNIYMMGHSQ